MLREHRSAGSLGLFPLSKGMSNYSGPVDVFRLRS